MKNVIITGADGFVGSYTVKRFLQENCRVLALGRGNSPRRLEAHDNLIYKKCDITELDQIYSAIEDKSYDTFLHFAWEGAAGKDRIDYQLQMKNALNTVECMKVAKQIGCTRFICAGSIMEYEVEAVVHAQGSKPSMSYIYGMGKHIAHCMCKSIATDIGIELIWPMITNAYGPGEYSPRFINTTLRKIINGEKLEFTAGTQNYDFVYITDVAEAFYLIAKNGKAYCEYMIGSGNAKPLKEFIIEMVEQCAPGIQPHFGDVPYTGTNMPIDTFSIHDIQRDCGFMPEVSFAEGTFRTMEWLRTL